MVIYSYNAPISGSMAPTGKCRTTWPSSRTPSWWLPHCCTGSSSWEQTKLSLDSGERTKTGTLLALAGEPLLSVATRLCNWNRALPCVRKSTPLLCCWEPMPQYSQDLTTLNRRTNLAYTIFTILGDFHFPINRPHLVDGFYLRRQSSVNAKYISAD